MSDFANSLLRRTDTNIHTPLVEEMPQPLPTPHNWYYDLRNIESHLSEGEELNENPKYKYYIELFNNKKYNLRKEILLYICGFDKRNFIIAINFLYRHKIITENLIKTLTTKYNLEKHDKLTLEYLYSAFKTPEGQ